MPHMCCEIQNKVSNTRVCTVGVYGINNKFTVSSTERKVGTVREFVMPLHTV